MMRGAEDIAGFPNGRAAIFAALVVPMMAGASIPATAQQGWMPTVATSPGAPIAPGAFSGATPVVDPRFFPSPRVSAAPPHNPLPQGAWSPIVTGALPNSAPPFGAPAAGSAQAPALRAPGSGSVPPVSANPARQSAADAATVPATPATTAKTTVESANQAGAANPLAEGATSSTGVSLPKLPGPLDAPPPNASPAQQYCYNTVDSAADARFAWQAKKIQDMEAELDKRSQQLEEKTQEYKRWLARRDEFSRKAQEKLVGFYAKMRPDAAALQLASMDEETAAAVLTKLETKVASQIMGEMVPEDAAKIATIISGAAKVPAQPRANTAADASGSATEDNTSADGKGAAAGPADSPDAARPPEQPKS
jgi:flagellar motility protein MotE (MotC chaperone)